MSFEDLTQRQSAVPRVLHAFVVPTSRKGCEKWGTHPWDGPSLLEGLRLGRRGRRWRLFAGRRWRGAGS